MAIGRLEGWWGQQCTGFLLPVLFVLVLISCWSTTVNGSRISIVGQHPRMSLPSTTIRLDDHAFPRPRSSSSCFWQDADALLDFRAQLSGPSGMLSSWDPLTDCCRWEGVTCTPPMTSSKRRITELQLTPDENSVLSLSRTFSNVAGTPLARLSFLEKLSLMSINFNAELPAAWGELANLKSLSLIDCGFKGTIPATFGSLRSLQHLHLSNNRLSGKLPPLEFFKGLKNLQTLDVSSNSLTGSILVLFRSSSTLSYLDVSGNDFDDDSVPDLFTFLPRLHHLDLSRNRLKGSIPSSLQLLTQLRFLDLSANDLDGSIPPALFRLPRLTSAFLQQNSLSGTIPRSFPSTSRIESLDLSDNSLSGTIPPTIGALRRLQSLDLSHNNLSAVIPDALMFNSRLEFLFLESNALTGIIPPELSDLSNLLLANVSHNLLLGPIPAGPWRSFPTSSYHGNRFAHFGRPRPLLI